MHDTHIDVCSCASVHVVPPMYIAMSKCYCKIDTHNVCHYIGDVYDCANTPPPPKRRTRRS